MYPHFWEKWCVATDKGTFGAAERFYLELSEDNRRLDVYKRQGFFFYPRYAFHYIFVKLDFANSVAFFKAFEKAINMYHTCLLYTSLSS